MNTAELVVEMRPEKNSGPYGIWTHDLCDTGVQIPYGPEFFSGPISTTSSVVFIAARIAYISHVNEFKAAVIWKGRGKSLFFSEISFQGISIQSRIVNKALTLFISVNLCDMHTT